MERVKGIEPSRPAWKAGALPLSYTRVIEKRQYWILLDNQASFINFFTITFILFQSPNGSCVFARFR